MKLRPALLLFALAVPTLAWGETPDPPERVARLSYVEGVVRFQGAQESATTTLPERPLLPGDRLVTEPGAHVELALGTAAIRLDERSEFSVVDLDATTVRVELTTGAASMYLHELLDDETFEIITPNTTITLDGPGEYRADVSADDSTALTVRSGVATAATADGPVRVAAGQRVRLEGRDAFARLEAPKPADAFDDWVLERELRLAEAEPRFTPYEGNDYEELDQYGEWYDEPRYGRVWMPGHRYAGWSPYHDGYWQRVGFGWSWFDPAPWGFFTFNSGRWAYLRHQNRWCWVPGPRFHPRPSAPDTAPFGQPRGNPRERVDREDGPRTADRPSNAGDTRPPVVSAGSDSRGNDIDRRPAPRREAASGERAGGGTITRAGNRDTRGGNRERSPSPPAATPPQQSGATIRPSRADPPPRSEATPGRTQGKATFGTRRTP